MPRSLCPHGGLLFRGQMLDLSISGCFIETAMPKLERGTLVEVYFRDPPASVPRAGQHR